MFSPKPRSKHINRMHIHGLERILRSLFYSYGGFIARHPLYFVIIPLFVAIGLGSGILFGTNSDVDTEVVYSPENSKAYRDRDLIEDIYSKNGGNNNMLTQKRRSFGSVVITLKDGGNVLTRNVTIEVLRLDEKIKSFSVMFASEWLSYRDICMKLQGNCIQNGVIPVFNSSLIMASKVHLSYPILYITNSSGSIPIFIGGELAGVTLKSGSSEVEAAKAIQLTYNLKCNSEEEIEKCVLWEKKFQTTVAGFQTEFVPHLKLFWDSSELLSEELDKSTSNLLGKFSVAITLLITFTIITCFMWDCVRSKIWLAAFGLISACLAVVASFGLLTYLEAPFVNELGATPFLIIGKLAYN